VRTPLDTSISSARRQLRIGDAAIRRVEGVDRDVQTSLQLLVRADLTECHAACKRAPLSHLETGHRHDLASVGRSWRVEDSMLATALARSARGSATDCLPRLVRLD